MKRQSSKPPLSFQERLTVWTVKVWGWLRRMLSLFVLLMLLLYVLLSLPFVQNWAARQATAFLSEQLQTRVFIEKVHIRPLEGADFHNLYVEDHRGDTLLVASHLSAGVRHTLFTLLWRRLEINQLSLENASLHLQRDSGQAYHNMQFLIDYFASAPEQPRRPFALNIQSLFLHQVHFQKDDAIRGLSLDAQLSDGRFFFRHFDLPSKRIAASRITLQNPSLLITQTQSHPLDSLAQATHDSVWHARRPHDTTWWAIEVDALRLADGQFSLHNHRNALPPRNDGTIDFNHLEIQYIAAEIDSFLFSKWTFDGIVRHIALQEQSGFVLDHLSAQRAHVDTTTTQLYGLVLQTPASHLSDTFLMHYPSFAGFRSFSDEVRMDARFNHSKLAVEDLLRFVPALRHNAFFRKNRKEVVHLDGRIYGTVNRLRGRHVRLQLAGATTLSGNFHSRDLAVPGEQFLTLELDQLYTDVPTLRQLIPRFDLPPNFDNLGRLHFTGEFNGFFNDFVAYGNLRTSIGRARMDMQLQVREGRERARYSGRLDLTEFDLGRFSNNPDLGKVTFRSRVLEGRGLTGETAQASLAAVVDSISYKGYRYQDIAIDGTLNRSLFDGRLVVQDDHIDFSFNGAVDFTEKEPLLDFRAHIRKLDLLHLRLADDDLTIKGRLRMNVRGIDPSRATGTALLRQLQITHRKKRSWSFDSLYLWTGYVRDSVRQLRLVSDMVDATLEGQFNPIQLHKAFFRHLRRNHPLLAQRLNIPAAEADTMHLHFAFHIRDAQNILDLVDPKWGNIRDLRLRGYLDTRLDTLDLQLDWPTFRYGTTHFDSIILLANMARHKGSIDIELDGIRLNGKSRLSPISFLGLLEGDTLDFSLTSINLTGFVDNLFLTGQLYPEEGGLCYLHFDPLSVLLWNDVWTLSPDNFIRFGKQYFETHQLELRSGQRLVRLQSHDAQALNLSLHNFDLAFVNELWIYPQLYFDGRFDLDLHVDNLFQVEGLELSAHMDSLLINGDHFGELKLLAHADKWKRPIFASLLIENGTQTLAARSRYNPPNYRALANPQLLSEQPNYISIDVELTDYPVRILEYWVAPAIHDTEGTLAGQARFEGLPQKIEVDGWATVRDVATTITYLNTRYFVKEHLVRISSDMFDATGALVYDELGHTATLRGGIAHDNLRHLRLDCDLITDRFLAMRTTRDHNPLYYGTAIGGGIVRFRGPFKLAEIEVDATAGPGTHLSIPITYEQDASEVQFITFTNTSDTSLRVQDPPSAPDIRGLNITLNLRLTPDARMELIFDERTGDILRGTGEGDIQIIVTRNGDFKMYGNYEVAEGEYLFTMMSLLLNKPFVVRPGGTITWSGDPFEANIDIQAVYKGVNTSIYTLIQEYLLIAPPEIVNLARTPTEVDLTMFLEGSLFQPQISFDIHFPKIPQELRNYVDTKMRALRQDPNELNRQVFGLLMLGQFLPTNYNFQLQQVADVGFNTLSEMIANQLSFYLTELVSEWVTDDGFISGIDFDFSYNTFANSQQGLSQIANSANEFQGRVKTYLFNDRAVFNIGANVGFNGNQSLPTTNQGTFVAGEFIFEYFLTEDRRLRIRAYHLSEPQIGGRRTKTGIGLSWRTAFDSFRELLQKKKKSQ